MAKLLFCVLIALCVVFAHGKNVDMGKLEECFVEHFGKTDVPKKIKEAFPEMLSFEEWRELKKLPAEEFNKKREELKASLEKHCGAPIAECKDTLKIKFVKLIGASNTKTLQDCFESAKIE